MPKPRLAELYISLHSGLAAMRDAELGAELDYPGYRRVRVERGTDGRWPERAFLIFAEGTAGVEVVARFFGLSRTPTDQVSYYDEIYPNIHIADRVVPQLILAMRGIAESWMQ